MPGDSRAAQLRGELQRGTDEVLLGVARLAELAAEYRRAAWGPLGEPNRANEALLALEAAADALRRAAGCYADPTRGTDR